MTVMISLAWLRRCQAAPLAPDMAPLATESYPPKMTGNADDPVWDAFVDAMLALGATGEHGSRYGDKPALVLDEREIAHREGPGLIDLRLTRQGWADVRAVFAGDPLIHRDPGRRDWIELRLESPDDLVRLRALLARAVAANLTGRMAGHDAMQATAEKYRRFARLEAAGRSPAYERLALAVAADAAILVFLQGLPPAKRQPNLLFAAARWILGSPAGIGSLRSLVTGRPGELAAVRAARRTQTNEAARCAVLLPALALLPGPLALIEVGASAGLTLLVDRYSYDYAGHLVAGADPQAPVLHCRPDGPGSTSIPSTRPTTATRPGSVACSGRGRPGGPSAWPERSRRHDGRRRHCTAATSWLTSPAWPRTPRRTRPSSSITPPCWPMSMSGNGASSPLPCAGSARSGYPTRPPACFPTSRSSPATTGPSS
jgi:hypothetical protein